eukprot:scaffold3639_cov141-Isochrysis_galbana.AAC.10
MGRRGGFCLSADSVRPGTAGTRTCPTDRALLRAIVNAVQLVVACANCAAYSSPCAVWADALWLPRSAWSCGHPS